MKPFTIILVVISLIGSLSSLIGGSDSWKANPTSSAPTGFPKVYPETDNFEISLSANKRVISCFHEPSEFFVTLKNKTDKPQRLFEYWNSWGYQNISFYLYTKDGTQIVTRKDQNFTRNFPSTYEIALGETMVFPLKFDSSWEELENIPEGESKLRIQVVYRCVPSFEAKDSGAWTGIVASKIYQQTFWMAHSSTIQNNDKTQNNAIKPLKADKSKTK